MFAHNLEAEVRGEFSDVGNSVRIGAVGAGELFAGEAKAIFGQTSPHLTNLGIVVWLRAPSKQDRHFDSLMRIGGADSLRSSHGSAFATGKANAISQRAHDLLFFFAAGGPGGSR